MALLNRSMLGFSKSGIKPLWHLGWAAWRCSLVISSGWVLSVDPMCCKSSSFKFKGSVCFCQNPRVEGHLLIQDEAVSLLHESFRRWGIHPHRQPLTLICRPIFPSTITHSSDSLALCLHTDPQDTDSVCIPNVWHGPVPLLFITEVPFFEQKGSQQAWLAVSRVQDYMVRQPRLSSELFGRIWQHTTSSFFMTILTSHLEKFTQGFVGSPA